MSLLAQAIVVNFCSPAFGNDANSARTPFGAAALPSAFEIKRDPPREFSRVFLFPAAPKKAHLRN
jgi:hypothetical protein